MYTSLYVVDTIVNLVNSKNVSLTDMLIELNIDTNDFPQSLYECCMEFEGLAKIADYLDCSVDYLLGRTNNPDAHK